MWTNRHETQGTKGGAQGTLRKKKQRLLLAKGTQHVKDF